MVWAWIVVSRCSLISFVALPGVKHATHGTRSILGPRKTSNVGFAPRRPQPERPAKYAFLARLRSGGAYNKEPSFLLRE